MASAPLAATGPASRGYPETLLAGRRCVVVGGGRLAERKVAGLVEADAPGPALDGLVVDWLAHPGQTP